MATLSSVAGERIVSLRKGLSIVRSGGGESLNQQSTVAKATKEKDGGSCLFANYFPPLHPAGCRSLCITRHLTLLGKLWSIIKLLCWLITVRNSYFCLWNITRPSMCACLPCRMYNFKCIFFYTPVGHLVVILCVGSNLLAFTAFIFILSNMYKSQVGQCKCF